MENTDMELNTYEVVLSRYGAKTVQAKSRAAAKYASFLDYDITGGLGFGAYLKWVESVRLLHKFRPSDLFGDERQFERMKEARGIPFAFMGQRVLLNSNSRGPIEGTLCGANRSQNLNVLFDGHTNLENCHPHYQMAYFDASGAIVADYRK